VSDEFSGGIKKPVAPDPVSLLQWGGVHIRIMDIRVEGALRRHLGFWRDRPQLTLCGVALRVGVVTQVLVVSDHEGHRDSHRHRQQWLRNRAREIVSAMISTHPSCDDGHVRGTE
jgi:hypothetical protein